MLGRHPLATAERAALVAANAVFFLRKVIASGSAECGVTTGGKEIADAEHLRQCISLAGALRTLIEYLDRTKRVSRLVPLRETVLKLTQDKLRLLAA
jgi:hypothetical protein